MDVLVVEANTRWYDRASITTGFVTGVMNDCTFLDCKCGSSTKKGGEVTTNRASVSPITRDSGQVGSAEAGSGGQPSHDTDAFEGSSHPTGTARGSSAHSGASWLVPDMEQEKMSMTDSEESSCSSAEDQSGSSMGSSVLDTSGDSSDGYAPGTSDETDSGCSDDSDAMDMSDGGSCRSGYSSSFLESGSDSS